MKISASYYGIGRKVQQNFLCGHIFDVWLLLCAFFDVSSRLETVKTER